MLPDVFLLSIYRMFTKVVSLLVLVAAVSGYYTRVQDKSGQEYCLITCAGNSSPGENIIIVFRRFMNSSCYEVKNSIQSLNSLPSHAETLIHALSIISNTMGTNCITSLQAPLKGYFFF